MEGLIRSLNQVLENDRGYFACEVFKIQDMVNDIQKFFAVFGAERDDVPYELVKNEVHKMLLNIATFLEKES